MFTPHKGYLGKKSISQKIMILTHIHPIEVDYSNYFTVGEIPTVLLSLNFGFTSDGKNTYAHSFHHSLLKI